MTSVVQNTTGWTFPVEEGWLAFDAMLERERDLVDEEFWSMSRCRERCMIIAAELRLRVLPSEASVSSDEGGNRDGDGDGDRDGDDDGVWDDDEPCRGGVCACCGRTRD